jgi:hypothetical protein
MYLTALKYHYFPPQHPTALMPWSYLGMSFKIPSSWKSGSCMHNCSQMDISTSSLHGTIIASRVTSAAQTNDLLQDVILQHDSGTPHSIHQTYCSHFTDNIMSIHHIVWPLKHRLAGHQFHNNVNGSMTPHSLARPCGSFVNTVALGKVFCQVLWFFPISIIPPVLHTLSSTSHRFYTLLEIESLHNML